MRLFVPHFICAAVLTSMSCLGALIIPSLRIYLGLFNVISVGVVYWILTVRMIEYIRVMKLLNPDTAWHRNALVRFFTEVLAASASDAMFLAHMQWAGGCKGRKRVVIAALAKHQDWTWKYSKLVIEDNHLTSRLGWSIMDYLWPQW